MHTLKAVLLAACLIAAPFAARAAVADVNFSGPGVSGFLHFTYGPATDAKYLGQAFEITGISGVFSDTNNGLNIVNAPVGALVPIRQDAPEPGNLLAPIDFSRFGPITFFAHDVLTYDNLYWPGGAAPTATDYQAAGGILDIYGVMFSIGNDRFVDFWSNGTFVPGGPIDYGVAVANSEVGLDYVGGDVFVPEPATLTLLGAGLLGLVLVRRRTG